MEESMEYKEYISTNLVIENNHPIHKYDEKILNLFDKYLHLTYNEYNEVKNFAFENNFIFNKRNLKFDINFGNSNKELDKKLFELKKIIPHLCIVTSHSKTGIHYSIHLQRYSWCRIHDNIILIKKWFNIKN